MTIITGHDAIEIAETFNMGLSKYNDPIEWERDDLTIEEAHDVAREDPSLIYIDSDDVPLVWDGCVFDQPRKMAADMFAWWLEANGSNSDAEVARSLVAQSNSSLIAEMKDEGCTHPRVTNEMWDTVIYNYRAGVAEAAA